MNKEQIKKQLEEFDKKTFEERLDRILFLGKLIGDEKELWMSQVPSFYLEEAKSCFITGNFVACIMICQSTIEELLRTYYRMSGKNKIVKMKSKDLIDRAESDKLISHKTAKELHELRLMRNPYSHVKAYNGKKTDVQWDWMPPLKNGQFDYNKKIKVEIKARKAMIILINYIYREMLKIV